MGITFTLEQVKEEYLTFFRTHMYGILLSYNKTRPKISIQEYNPVFEIVLEYTFPVSINEDYILIKHHNYNCNFNVNWPRKYFNLEKELSWE